MRSKVVAFLLPILLEIAISSAYPHPQPNSHLLQSSVDIPMTMPAMARKAGGNWKPELLKSGQDTTKEVENDDDDETKEENYDYELWEGYKSSEEEEECPEKMFFHVRGKQCVPIRCPQDTKRNQRTGACDINPYYNYRSRYSGAGYYSGSSAGTPNAARASFRFMSGMKGGKGSKG